MDIVETITLLDNSDSKRFEDCFGVCNTDQTCRSYVILVAGQSGMIHFVTIVLQGDVVNCGLVGRVPLYDTASPEICINVDDSNNFEKLISGQLVRKVIEANELKSKSSI